MSLQKHAGVEEPFKEQGRPMDVNVRIYNKLLYLVSDASLQLIFKTLPLVEFWYINKE